MGPNGTDKIVWAPIKKGANVLHFSEDPKKRLPSGVYYYDFTYTDPQTKKYKHSKVSTGEKDYRRAKAKHDDLYLEVLAGIFAEEVKFSDKQPLIDFIEHFLLTKEQEGRVPKTLSDYRQRLLALCKWTDPQLPLSNVSTDLIRKFLFSISSLSTRNLTKRVLSAAFNWAVNEGKLQQNPVARINLKSANKPVRDYLTNEEFSRLYMRMGENTYSESATKFATLLSFSSGMRVGEICNIKLSAIRWERLELIVKKTKNGQERILPVAPQIEQALKLQLKNKASSEHELVRDSPFLFCNEAGRPYITDKDKSSKLSRLFKKACREALKDREGIHFHSLRHSFAQNAYNAGMPLVEISKIIGHSSIAVTQIYAKQSAYNNLTAITNYMKEQTIGLNNAPIGGAIQAEEIECAHLDTTTSAS